MKSPACALQFRFRGLAFRPFRFPVLLGTRKNITQIRRGRQARTASPEGDRGNTSSMGWIGRVSASQADLLAALRRPWPGRSASSWSAVSRLGGASAVRTPRAPPLSCPARGGVGSVGGDPVPGLPCRPDGAPPGLTRHDRESPEPAPVPRRGQRLEGEDAIRRGVEELSIPEASSDDRPALIEASARARAGTRNQERERPSMASGASVRWKPAAPWPRAASTPLKAAPSGGDTRAPGAPRLISRSPGCRP